MSTSDVVKHPVIIATVRKNAVKTIKKVKIFIFLDVFFDNYSEERDISGVP